MYDLFSSPTIFVVAIGILSLSPDIPIAIPSLPSALETSWTYAQAWTDSGDAIAASKIYNQAIKFADTLSTTEEQTCGEKITKYLKTKRSNRPYEQLWADCLTGINPHYANAIASHP